MNFVVTQYTSYINERSKNFTHSDCEEHFYPKDTRLSTDVDDRIAALQFFDFAGMLSIYALMVVSDAWAALHFFIAIKRRPHTDYFKQLPSRPLAIHCRNIEFLMGLGNK